MNEQRIAEYVQLIEQLLECPNGQEPEILANNAELVDEGLVLTMTVFADQIDDENMANFLRQIASQLAEQLGMSESNNPGASLQGNNDYLNFLMRVLTKVAESRANPQVVYPLLGQNLDKLDKNFAQVLRKWTTKKLANIEKQEGKNFIAACISEFGGLIQEFSLGSKLQNIEIAIICYEITASIFTFQTVPQMWAYTQNNLGEAYSERIKGSASHNIEKSIKCFQAALTVFTPDTFPQEWAVAQNNLAAAYRKRIKGSASDNIEMSIKCFQAALTVFTPDEFPQEWAVAQNNLGEAYSKRTKGSASDNLEMSIKCFQAALTVFTPDEFPQQCATAQDNLAIAYRKRSKGSASDNLER